MKHLSKLYARYREVILYLIFGVLTTVVDFAVYTPLTALFGSDYKIFGLLPWYLVTSVVAWLAAVLFSFFTNKAWVFREKDWSFSVTFKELISFLSGRVLTLLIQLLLMWLMIDLAHLDKTALLAGAAGLLSLGGDVVVKAIVSLVVIVLNYIISKLFVFRPAHSAEESTPKPEKR